MKKLQMNFTMDYGTKLVCNFETVEFCSYFEILEANWKYFRT